MDFFPGSTGSSCTTFDWGKGAGVVMGYFDGNTVTGMWNYAQYFAINDNSYRTTFGPSTPGAVNLVAGISGNADRTLHRHQAWGPEADVGVGTCRRPRSSYDDCGTRTRRTVKRGA